jgi:hypothetical protein
MAIAGPANSGNQILSQLAGRAVQPPIRNLWMKLTKHSILHREFGGGTVGRRILRRIVSVKDMRARRLVELPRDAEQRKRVVT